MKKIYLVMAVAAVCTLTSCKKIMFVLAQQALMLLVVLLILMNILLLVRKKVMLKKCALKLPMITLMVE